MTKTLYFAKIALVVSLLALASNLSNAQPLDYEKAMDDIMDSYLSDYPEPTLKALDKLFDGVNINELPAKTRFFYYYYYGGCLVDKNHSDAEEYLTEARKVAYSNPEVGIRNKFALGAEKSLADLYLSKGTEEYSAAAMLLYNDIITVGISLLEDIDIAGMVVMSWIEEAKMGVKTWMDPDWVKKIWIQTRDLALEINDGTYYSYYVLNVLNYYCDLGDYDTALAFMEDAKNKEILKVDVISFCQHISDAKKLLPQIESIKVDKGANSIEYWSSKLDLATLSTVLCSKDAAFSLLQEVEQGLVNNRLTDSYEYAQVLFLLSNNTFEKPDLAEQYFLKQINVLETTPQYFAYTSDTEVFNSLAVCQMKQGKYFKAQENYQKALECLERDKSYSDQPGYKSILSVVYHNVGRNLYFLSRYNESVDFFSKSIALQEEVNGTVMPKTKVYLSESLNHISKN